MRTPLDISKKIGIIDDVPGRKAGKKAVLCNGSTADSDSVCLGSNPGTAAKEGPGPNGAQALFICLCRSLTDTAKHGEVWLSLVERYVRDVEAAGSNPVTSTILRKPKRYLGKSLDLKSAKTRMAKRRFGFAAGSELSQQQNKDK